MISSKMMIRLQIAMPLLLVYLALSHKPGENILPNLVFGAVIAFYISLLFPSRPHPLNWSGVASFFDGLFRYALLVIVDMFKSAYNVALIVLDPNLPIRPGIIAINSGCTSRLATALSAHAITITPGEMVIAMDERGILYTHSLDINRSAEHSDDAQSLRRALLSKIVN